MKTTFKTRFKCGLNGDSLIGTFPDRNQRENLQTEKFFNATEDISGKFFNTTEEFSTFPIFIFLPKPPRGFAEAYPGTAFHVVNRDNFWDYVR
ncbi:hypothetical protein [Prevotellamassilia timonensis]|uniref:hypothetical protein n=1 Tax=Prevotellamassilia timonensis TaxID=1852370 RepID=UPI001F31415B|nr:hypothetical protein [Prevotellamassilia timonensis]MCF2635676.1 hypothetical protein [Prevotellamassilia timonensis]MCI7168783.1 hypothetical protein [Bacteroidales bacterium]